MLSRLFNLILAPQARLLVAAAAMLLVVNGGRIVLAVESYIWTNTPYEVQTLLAVDTTGDSAALADAIATRLDERAQSSIGAVWRLKVEATSGLRHYHTTRAVETGDISAILGKAKPEENGESETAEDDSSTDAEAESPEKMPDEMPFKNVDKVFLVTVTQRRATYVVAAREYDTYLQQMSLLRTENALSAADVPEATYRLLCRLFSPIAQFSVDPEKPEFATLEFRGSSLPQKQPGFVGAAEGEILLPILRRTDRSGVLAKDGIQAAPWTYFKAEEGGKLGRILSHTRRPFGARRRGRIEQLAMRLRVDPAETTLRLRARGDAERALVGYEGFVEDGDRKAFSIGRTGNQGLLTVEPGESVIQMVTIKSGSKLVARLPVAAGVAPIVEVPLPDDTKRLEAESKLALLREQLIDLVARRSILVARIESNIEKNKLEQARELLNQLEGLPGRAVFAQRLDTEQQLIRSDNPMVQQGLDRLFDQTRVVLGAFLSSQPIKNLNVRLGKAEIAEREAESSEASATPTATEEQAG